MQTGVNSEIIQGYQKMIGKFDEVLDINGNIKPHWRQLFDNMEAVGLNELSNRSADIISKLHENGVTYNVYDKTDDKSRRWQLDPIPFLLHEQEWLVIEKGLIQRAKLLNAIYEDFYGEQNLIKEGVFPAHVMYGNDGYFLNCKDVKIASQNQIVLYAADFARGPDNRMWVFDNRTQSPSGMGYVLENRGVITKFLPELTQGLSLRKLTPFFNTFQNAVLKAAPNNAGQPNVVYFTPGANSETFFEHSYLSSYFGYTLVQGDDLLVRNGFVWLKTISGLEKVDVIIRRVDDEYCDPLELRADSHLGVAGLLHVIRLGNVTVLNPIGSSVLENHALLPFMASACKHIFGEELILPNVATWWCGQPNELSFVLENLDKLVIKKANRRQRYNSIFGRQLDQNQLAELRLKITQNPLDYVAQQETTLTTIPSLINGQIVPRLAATRAYLVFDGNEYQVMKGGLTRSSAYSDKFLISNQLGGISKDTWIVSDTPAAPSEKIVFSSEKIKANKAFLPSSSAENLFWAGRYIERTLTTSKFVKLIINGLQENISQGISSNIKYLHVLKKALFKLTFYEPETQNEIYNMLMPLVYNANETSSLSNDLKSFINNVTAVNDKWNHDTRKFIQSLNDSLFEISKINLLNPNTVQKSLSRLQRRTYAFYGIISESFPRDVSYYIFEIGKQLERILSQIAITRSVFSKKEDAATEKDLIEAILKSHNLLVYYRQIYKSFTNLETALNIILFDSTLPFSLDFLMEQLANNVKKLPNVGQNDKMSEAAKLILKAHTTLKLTNTENLGIYNEDSMTLFNLDRMLMEIQDCLANVGDALSNQYFAHSVVQHSLLSYPDLTNQQNEI